jgi:hypothetical protein
MAKLDYLTHSAKLILSLMVIATCVFLHSCRNPSGNGDLVVSGKSDFADTAVSTIRIYKDDKGRQVLEKNNTYYDIVELHDSVGLKKILLKITKAETDLDDSGTSQSHFIVSAANIGDTKPGWKKEFAGDDIDYTTNKVLVVHSEGRNQNEEDTYTQYSLKTGEKLMTYTYAPLSVTLAGDIRFLGYLSRQSATDKPKGFAQVSYVSKNELIDQVIIKLKGADTTFPSYTPELKMKVVPGSGNALSNDERMVIMGRLDKGFTAKDINNFAIQVNFTPEDSPNPIYILLPVRDDRLDIVNARYDRTIFELSKSN